MLTGHMHTLAVPGCLPTRTLTLTRVSTRTLAVHGYLPELSWYTGIYPGSRGTQVFTRALAVVGYLPEYDRTN